jgi:GNAT superfamily N-acetyltransferase
LIVQEAFWLADPGRFEGRVMFIPEEETPAIFHSALDEFERIATERGAKKFSVWERSHRHHALQAMHDRGYSPTQRNREGYVPVAHLENQGVQQSIEKARELGYQFLTLSDYRETESGWLDKYYRFVMDLMRDVPLPQPFEDLPRDVFEKDLQTSNFDLIQLAKDNSGVLVGMSSIDPNKADPTLGHTKLTAVARGHRRKGLAKALKLAVLWKAKNLGMAKIYTDTEEDNPMYDLNQQLGFVDEFMWVCFEKKLDEA